jgi:hypothetical protein
MGTWASFPGGKAVRGKAPAFSAELKNAWSYTSTPPYVFKAWGLIQHRGNFIFSMFIEVTTIGNLFFLLYNGK